LVTSDPTDQGHGMKGFRPLPAPEAFDVVLRSAGARPNDRDVMETRIIDEIARSVTIANAKERPGKVRNSVAEAGGWPVYARNSSHWSAPIPASPNADDDHDGYTNIEEWLQQLSSKLEQPKP
jgi:hypothetical protein